MSYVIFTIDFENNPFRMNLFNNFIAEGKNYLRGNVMPMIGSYKGKREHSFIMRRDDFDDFIRPSRWIAKQESILHVASGNKMETYLEYLATGDTEHLGCMHQVCREEAEQAEAWTYSPSLNAYWIAKEGNPDGSYRESVAAFRNPRGWEYAEAAVAAQ